MIPQNERIVQKKSEDFAVRVTNAYNYLKDVKKEKVISLQLFRSGTSVQAMIAEAQYAQSTADFINKLEIALKEANESRNWIKLLYRTNYINLATYNSIYNDINQIIMLLIAIVRKTKSNIQKSKENRSQSVDYDLLENSEKPNNNDVRDDSALEF